MVKFWLATSSVSPNRTTKLSVSSFSDITINAQHYCTFIVPSRESISACSWGKSLCYMATHLNVQAFHVLGVVGLLPIQPAPVPMWLPLCSVPLRALEGCRFRSDRDAKTTVVQWFQQHSRGPHQLMHWWDTCLITNKHYFEWPPLLCPEESLNRFHFTERHKLGVWRNTMRQDHLRYHEINME